MPTVDKITESDKSIISKLRNGTLSGYESRTPSIEISGVDIVGVNPTENSSLFIDKPQTKKKIVLHQTVGILSSDLEALTSQRNMSTAYIIARDGTIIELFNPSRWSYHLGRGSVGGNGYNSMQSIAIEISNYGPLEFKSVEGVESFYNVYGSKFADGNEKMDSEGVCSDSGTTPVVTKLVSPYRGFTYYASFTDSQYTALKKLLAILEHKFAIPHNFIEYKNRFKIFADSATAKSFTGICSHVNFRPSGKWDLGAFFKWDRITDLSDDVVDFTDENDEELTGLEVITEEKYDGTDDNYEFTDTIDPLSGAVVEFASDKKSRIICENSPMICGV